MRPMAFFLAMSVAACAAAQDCRPASWLRLSGDRPAAVSPTELIADMALRDVVLLGEHHHEADHHRWQLHTLAALHAQRPQMVIGFEMFPRRAQPVLDRWIAGELTAAQFLAEARWDEVWNQPAELYLPLFEFARLQRIPIAALNVERRLAGAVAEKGWEAVPEQEREGLSRPAPPSLAYRDTLFDVYREHRARRDKPGATPDRSDAAFGRFVEAQQTWDRALAEGLARHARRASAAAGPLVVGIIGSGHLRYGHGVVLQLRDLGVDRIGTLLPLAARSQCAEARPGLADAVFLLPER
jgi:uncharacterized iron-regulated protein